MKKLIFSNACHRVLLFTAVGSTVALALTALGILRGLSAALDAFGVPGLPQ